MKLLLQNIKILTIYCTYNLYPAVHYPILKKKKEKTKERKKDKRKKERKKERKN